MLKSLLLIMLATPTQSAPQQTTCGACNDVGTLPCPGHKREEPALETGALFCSVAMQCDQCAGTLTLDCEKCPLGDARLARARRQNQEWKQSMQEHWDRIGDPFPIGRSPHFLLFWSGQRIVIKRKGLSEHEALHLYLNRLESLYEQFKVALAAKDEDFSTVFNVMVWKRQKHQNTAAAHYTGQPLPNATGTKRMGAVGYYTVFLDPDIVDPDESVTADLYRAIVHNVSHLLLANVWNARWPGELQGGWIDAGVAHYFEQQLHQRCTNFCYREQDTLVSYKGGRWEAPVKKLARSKKLIPFADTASKRTTELELEEHALCWSYCEFLIATNPEGFGAICLAIKQGQSYRQALKKHFDLSPLTLQDAWREHVIKNYKGR